MKVLKCTRLARLAFSHSHVFETRNNVSKAPSAIFDVTFSTGLACCNNTQQHFAAVIVTLQSAQEPQVSSQSYLGVVVKLSQE
jgi:hypothetical protein